MEWHIRARDTYLEVYQPIYILFIIVVGKLNVPRGGKAPHEVVRTLSLKCQAFLVKSWHSATPAHHHSPLRLSSVSPRPPKARQNENEALEHARQLRQALAESLKEQTPSKGDGQATGIVEEQRVIAGGSLIVRKPLPHDFGHLEGITRDQFEVQRRNRTGEKSAREKMEEEIVLEYVKKQSLLEAQHRSKGKGRAAATEYDSIR